MRAAILSLIAAAAFAQSYTLTPTSATVPAGQPVTLTLALVSGGGPAALEFFIDGLPQGGTVTTALTGKAIQCNFVAPDYRCLISDASPVTAAENVGIPDGTIATITYTQPSTAASLTIPLASLSAASPAGAPVTLTPPAGAVSVTVQSKCDLNGDGKVDATDIGLSIMSVLAGGSSALTALDVERVIIASFGGACLR